MKINDPVATCRICLLLPSFNNENTIAAVVREASSYISDVIVVDDGSTDTTSGILSDLENITVVTHDRNRGKGAALQTGMEKAQAMGFTHAITMDTDGQHLAEDIEKFILAIHQHPRAMILGVRQLTWANRKSRILRAHSDFWVWAQTGKWVRDSQSGFRAYPLEAIGKIHLKTQRYDFEIEALVKALWAGVACRHVDVGVRYNTGSHSHFRPLRDFAWVTHLNACLLMQRLMLPSSACSMIHSKEVHRQPAMKRIKTILRMTFLPDTDTPNIIAASTGVGVACGILPIWGFQIPTAFFLAHKLKLNKALTVAASNISFPLMIPVILYTSLLVGRWVLTGSATMALQISEITPSIAWNYAREYFVGSIILAVVSGLLAGALVFVFMRLYARMRATSAKGTE